MIVSVSMEASRQGSYVVVKDRWRSSLQREGRRSSSIGSPGNARSWAECDVLMRGGQEVRGGECRAAGEGLTSSGCRRARR